MSAESMYGLFDKTTPLSSWHELVGPLSPGATGTSDRLGETVRTIGNDLFVLRALKQLEERVSEIRQLLEELSRCPLVSTINLYDLGTDSLRMKLPISVVLHCLLYTSPSPRD